MNTNIKKIAAITLTLSALASITPETSLNILGVQKASAASNSKIYFDSLRVSGAGNIKLSNSKTKYSIYVPKSQETATITIKKDSSKDIIEADGDNIKDISGNEEGESTCRIKVELENKGSTANEYDIKVSNGDKERTYTLKIYRKNTSSDDDEDNDDIYLDKIVLSEGEINFSRKKASFDVYLDKNVDSIKIQAKPEDEDYKVEIAGEEVDEDCKWRTEVDLKEGKNVIEIYIEDEDDDDNPRRTYTLNIYVGIKPADTGSGEIDTKQDKIYIKNILIDDGDIPVNFDKEVTSYDIKVDKNLDSLIIKAEPEDDNLVKINGSKADSKYRKRVSLNSTGKTVIEVKVYSDLDDDDDDYEERIYNLNVIKEDSTTDNNENTTNNNSDNSSVISKPNTDILMNCNKWVKNEYGLWQYYDALGKPLVNQWFRDGANWYYLDNYGIMQTGWLFKGGKWYFLNNSGAMQTGWIQERGIWYFMNSDGSMKTGWHFDSNGKWYYLNEYGAMVTNCFVGKYRIGTDGAWIK